MLSGAELKLALIENSSVIFRDHIFLSVISLTLQSSNGGHGATATWATDSSCVENDGVSTSLHLLFLPLIIPSIVLAISRPSDTAASSIRRGDHECRMPFIFSAFILLPCRVFIQHSHFISSFPVSGDCSERRLCAQRSEWLCPVTEWSTLLQTEADWPLSLEKALSCSRLSRGKHAEGCTL